MKKTPYFIFSFLAIVGMLFCSCSKDEPSPRQENYNKFKTYYDALFNTTWKVVEEKDYRDDRLYRDHLQEELERFNANEKLIHFTSAVAEDWGSLKPDCKSYNATCNLFDANYDHCWWIDESRFDSNNTPLPGLGICISGEGDHDYVIMGVVITRFNPNRIEMDYTEIDEYGTKYRWLTVLEKVSDDTPSSESNKELTK